ncbi:hypothetical protein I317_00704 [Kwoniella heveanensis CBS 569]|nr:hypothetical protein I317_00704 [Kwoniella heveanensis CBS 569]
MDYQEPTDSQESEDFMILDHLLRPSISEEMESLMPLVCVDHGTATALPPLASPGRSAHPPSDPYTDPVEPQEAGATDTFSSPVPGADPGHGQRQDNPRSNHIHHQGIASSSNETPAEGRGDAPLADQPADDDQLILTLRAATAILKTQHDLYLDIEAKREKAQDDSLRRLGRIDSAVGEIEDLMQDEGLVEGSAMEKNDNGATVRLRAEGERSEEVAASSVGTAQQKLKTRSQIEKGSSGSSSAPGGTQHDLLQLNDGPASFPEVIDLTDLPDDDDDPSCNHYPRLELADRVIRRYRPITRSQTGSVTPRVLPGRVDNLYPGSAAHSRSSSTSINIGNRTNNSQIPNKKKGSRTFKGRTSLADRGEKLGMSDGIERVSGAVWPPRKSATVKGVLQTMKCDACDGHVHWACAGFEEEQDMHDVEWICPDCVERKRQGIEKGFTWRNEKKCIRPTCVQRLKQKIEQQPGDENLFVVESIIGEPKKNIPHIDSMLQDFHQDASDENLDPRRKIVLLEEARQAWDEQGNLIIQIQPAGQEPGAVQIGIRE